MKKILRLIIVIIIVFGIGWLYWPNIKLLQVRYLLNTVIEKRLPIIEDGEIYGTISEEFTDPIGKGCYFARDYIVIVYPTKSTEDAMASYIDNLLQLGWGEGGGAFNNDGNIRLNISTDPVPIIEIHKIADYSLLRKNFKGVLTISIDYVLPSCSYCNL